MDEWLSVGDGSFAERAQQRLKNLVDQAEILVIASHSRELIQTACGMALVLQAGQISRSGSSDTIFNGYF
jgi:ABC-type polysaccharide/polyol phosphate transport system ATPase subunit